MDKIETKHNILKKELNWPKRTNDVTKAAKRPKHDINGQSGPKTDGK